tara:strand:- start:443 stop:1366 length:924 start_codon:yes stop_codon:yes gene_type:complete
MDSNRSTFITQKRTDAGLSKEHVGNSSQRKEVTDYLKTLSNGISPTPPHDLINIPPNDPITLVTDERIHPEEFENIIDLDYCAEIRDIYSVVKDGVILEIAAARVRFVEYIYNYYGIARYTGVEPKDEWFMEGNRSLKAKADFKWNMVNSDYQSYSVKGTPDVVVCCGLSYHLHSPFHLWEWLANTNAEYIILETTGVPEDWDQSGDPLTTVERIAEQVKVAKDTDNYLQLKDIYPVGLRWEEPNIPGNVQTTKKRSIPWAVCNMNPDLRILAFNEMGYDLDASSTRYGGYCLSKQCIDTQRFKRRD